MLIWMNMMSMEWQHEASRELLLRSSSARPSQVCLDLADSSLRVLWPAPRTVAVDCVVIFWVHAARAPSLSQLGLRSRRCHLSCAWTGFRLLRAVTTKAVWTGGPYIGSVEG